MLPFRHPSGGGDLPNLGIFAFLALFVVKILQTRGKLFYEPWKDGGLPLSWRLTAGQEKFLFHGEERGHLQIKQAANEVGRGAILQKRKHFIGEMCAGGRANRRSVRSLEPTLIQRGSVRHGDHVRVPVEARLDGPPAQPVLRHELAGQQHQESGGVGAQLHGAVVVYRHRE